MGNTLDNIRTGNPGLNSDLGLSGDSDNRFGTSAQRNGFIQQAFRKLWPMMGRYVVEEVDGETNVMEYVLEAIQDIERILLINTQAQVVGRIPSWDLTIDEDSDPADLRLTVQMLTIPITMRVYGYAPYTVPASATSTSELPANLEHIVITGARAEAYRFKLNQFVDYEQGALENRTTAMTAEQMAGLYQAAVREFEQLRRDYARTNRGARRGRLAVGFAR